MVHFPRRNQHLHLEYVYCAPEVRNGSPVEQRKHPFGNWCLDSQGHESSSCTPRIPKRIRTKIPGPHVLPSKAHLFTGIGNLGDGRDRPLVRLLPGLLHAGVVAVAHRLDRNRSAKPMVCSSGKTELLTCWIQIDPSHGGLRAAWALILWFRFGSMISMST